MGSVLLAALLASGAGTPVWSGSVSVGLGDKRTLKTKGVQAGTWYRLVTQGRCDRVSTGPRKTRRWREKVNPAGPTIFGVEFKVRVGGAGPFSVDHEARETEFKADRDDPEITIEDQSSPQPGARCRLTEVALVSAR